MRHLLLLALLAATTALSITPPGPPVDSAAQAGLPSEADQQGFIFYAVLEGLFADGVSNEVVDAVTEADESTGWPLYFIYACPVCMPCFDAFRVYRGRPEFFGRKLPTDTFGPGLPESVRAQILSEDREVRVAAIRDRIEIWISRRLESLRLTPAEETEVRARFRGIAEKGQALLDSYQAQDRTAIYGHMEYCPFCEGASRAAGH